MATFGGGLTTTATLVDDAVTAAKIAAGAVGTSEIDDLSIVNADVSASEAIVGSKLQALVVGTNAGVIPSTGVATAHISATAGIVDTQLATITTAGKVSGAALTLLANIPAGAGVFPSANVPSGVRKNGVTTYDMTTASGDKVIGHGAGVTPTQVRITALIGPMQNTGDMANSFGVWNSTQTSCAWNATKSNATIGGARGTSTTELVHVTDSSDTNSQGATVAVDGTNITLSFTKAGTPTGTMSILWEATT